MTQFRSACALFTAAAILMPALACNQPGPGPQPPEIPPASTFVIDFSDFDEESENGKQARQLQSLPGENWTFAAATVGFWNTVLTITLAVPVAAFLESFNHTPQLDGETWVWSYGVLVHGANYAAELHADTDGPDVVWNMYISREGQFENVNWFSGRSTLVGTEGTWTLNRDPMQVEPFLFIEWSRQSDGSAGEIRYTNIAEGEALEDSYIHAAIDESAELDASYEVFNSAEDRTTFIEWDRETLAGRVRSEARFGDDEFHCWDEDLQDADCE